MDKGSYSVASYWGLTSFYTAWNPNIAAIIMRALGEAGLSFPSLICDIGVSVRPF